MEELAGELDSIDVVDGQGRSCCHIAASLGHSQCLMTLVRHGCNTNLQDKEGRTALHYVIIKILLFVADPY